MHICMQVRWTVSLSAVRARLSSLPEKESVKKDDVEKSKDVWREVLGREIMADGSSMSTLGR